MYKQMLSHDQQSLSNYKIQIRKITEAKDAIEKKNQELLKSVISALRQQKMITAKQNEQKDLLKKSKSGKPFIKTPLPR